MSSSLLSAAVHVARCFSRRKRCRIDGNASIKGCDVYSLVLEVKATETYTLKFLLSSLKGEQRNIHSQNSTSTLFVLFTQNKRTMITLHNVSRSTKTKINSKRGALGIKMLRTRTVTAKQQLKD